MSRFRVPKYSELPRNLQDQLSNYKSDMYDRKPGQKLKSRLQRAYVATSTEHKLATYGRKINRMKTEVFEEGIEAGLWTCSLGCDSGDRNGNKPFTYDMRKYIANQVCVYVHKGQGKGKGNVKDIVQATGSNE